MFIQERFTAAQLAASTSLKLNCPILSTADQEDVMAYTANYKEYHHRHGTNSFMHGIDTAAQNSMAVGFHDVGIAIDWPHSPSLLWGIGRQGNFIVPNF